MDKINPTTFVTDWDPIPERTLNASSWFENEYIEVKVEEGEKGMIAYYQAQGWVAYDVYASSVHIGGGDSGVTAWTYRMKRRKMQSERVLQDMINEFTSAYNEGRDLNDTRYDEIVAIYAETLDKTEDALNTLESDDTTYESLIGAIINGIDADFEAFESVADSIIQLFQESHAVYKVVASAMESSVESDYSAYRSTVNALIDVINTEHDTYDSTVTAITDAIGADHENYDALVSAILASMQSDYTSFADVADTIIEAMESDFSTFSTEMDGILDDYGESIRTQINTRFDNELAKSKQALVDRGMYNSTVWNSISAGIERERSLALSDIDDKITQQDISVKREVYAQQVAMRERILFAKDRLYNELRDVRAYTAETHSKVMAVRLETRSQILRVLESLQSQLNSMRGQEISTQDRLYNAKASMREIVRSSQDRLQSHLDATHDKRLAARERLYSAKVDSRNGVLAARDRLRASLRGSTDRRLVMRNQIVTAMMDFMERRTDDYPGIGQLASIASQLGYSEGGTVAPPS